VKDRAETFDGFCTLPFGPLLTVTASLTAASHQGPPGGSTKLHFWRGWGGGEWGDGARCGMDHV
jgi:hypothetical protein